MSKGRLPVNNIYKNIVDNLHEGVYFVDRERRITYWNRGAERITGYSAAEVIGRSCSDNLLLHVNSEGCCLCAGSCPLVDVMQHQCEHKNDQIYLHHKDGHRVPVAVSVSLIRDENGMSVGAAEVFSEIAGIDDEALMIEALKRESLIDMLTSLPNRRYLQTHLAGSMLEFERHGIGFGVIFADVDHFKAFNDTYGHAVGDDVLRLVGTTLGGCMRAYDMVGRWGGEEFLAVVHFADEYQLRLVAEKLRMLVEQSFLSHAGERLQVTMTFGVTRVKPGDTVEALLGRADRLLYEGKAAGRNRAQFG